MTIPRCQPIIVTAKPCSLALLPDSAVQLPSKHCSFKHCSWLGDNDDAMRAHLLSQHKSDLHSTATLFHASHTEDDRFVAAYNAALSQKVRRGAPLACPAIDRRSLYNYISNLGDETVDSLTCFSCARKYPHVTSFKRNDISWCHPCEQPGLFLGLSADQTEQFFGFETYMKRYGLCPGLAMPDLRAHPEEFADWTLTVELAIVRYETSVVQKT